jgi:hypothetical protein
MEINHDIYSYTNYLTNKGSIDQRNEFVDNPPKLSTESISLLFCKPILCISVRVQFVYIIKPDKKLMNTCT